MAEEERRIVVFTLGGCEPCEILKMYIEQKDIDATIIEVDTEISRETLTKIFPDVDGFPYPVVNNQPVGDLIFYLESGL